MITNIEITIQEGLRHAQLEGKLEGEVVGFLKGKLEIARKLLLRGDTPDEIAELTGLVRADIDKLSKELH